MPIGWTDVYVDTSYTELPTLARQSPDTLIATLIEQTFGSRVVEIRQDITAVPLPPHLAEALQAEAGSAALRVIRHYLDKTGMIIEISENHSSRRPVHRLQPSDPAAGVGRRAPKRTNDDQCDPHRNR